MCESSPKGRTMTSTHTPSDPTAGRCPTWCDVKKHRLETDGAILHARGVGHWSIC